MNSSGWLSGHLLGVTLSSGEWVLWLLCALSVISVAVILERLVFFSTRGLKNPDQLAMQLAQGQLTEAQASLTHAKGMEAAVLRDGLANVGKGAETVEQVVAAAVARERPEYERFLSFLGTLGSNAPFVGLFGTVLGIIRAFHDLGNASGSAHAGTQQAVMGGISEALVATAVGLAVAIPAVVAYNAFNRRLKTLVARTASLTYALVGHLRAERPGSA